ncbi:MAG: hypothetical protein LBH69_05220 [Methanomassiliicoccaceae archaeon]|jgi:predicted ferric reductase|nr:hypothetical protein [Methanomassiliicoccaceae archaeon]
MAERPQIVLIVVIIVAIVGLIQILNGLGLMDIGPFNPVDKPADIGQDVWDLAMKIAGFILIFIGVITLIIALLVYKGSNFARRILIIILILGVFGSLLSFPSVWAIIDLVLCIVLLYILFRPDVKQYFKS